MKKFISIFVCLLIACLLLPLPVLAAKKGARKPVFEELSSATNHPLAILSEMKHWSNPDYTRISLELDRDVTWETHELGKGNTGKPGRIYIDLKHAKLGKNVRDITIGDGLLKGARIGQYRSYVVRVVLDTENIKDYKVFPLSAPSRLIIDVKGERPTEISRLEQSINTKLEPPPETRRQSLLPRSPRRRSGQRRG